MLCFGIDAGGTKTELLAAPTGGGTQTRFFGPAANLQRLGVEQTADVLAALIREARAAHPSEPVGAVFAGVAGAGRPDEAAALADAVLLRLPDLGAPFEVTHDADIALEGAFGGESGVIVIAGTGSVALGRTRGGVSVRTGGWGYLFGDEGSGHAIGCAAMRALAAAFDADRPTPLATRLRDRLGLDDGATLIRRVYREAWPVAGAARVVCDAAAEGDADAARILREQAAALAEQVGMLAARAGDDLAPRIALLGGLVQAPCYRDALTAALGARLLGWAVGLPKATAAEGAWARACRASGKPV